MHFSLTDPAFMLLQICTLECDVSVKSPMPMLFLGHGSPMNALESNRWTQQWRLVTATLKPKAILLISAHWDKPGLRVLTDPHPRTIHDFGGFPPALFQQQYPAPGSVALAGLLLELLADVGARPDSDWGFDHGAWVPYLHLFPNGGPPMLQLSMPVEWSSQTAMKVGELLGEFARQHKAVVVGSGSLTHNFEDMDLRGAPQGQPTPPEYLTEFTEWVKARLSTGDRQAIAQAEHKAPHFARAHPDDDHYLPLPFALGAAGEGAMVEALPEEVRYKALSMQSFAFTH